MQEPIKARVTLPIESKTYFVGVFRWRDDIGWQIVPGMFDSYDAASAEIYRATGNMDGVQYRVVQFELPIFK